MNLKLQQAMTSAREGRPREAQVLLTKILSEDPEEAHAWFLLSLLVDSEQKQIAYLQKVLSLDPHHERAAQRLAQLEREPAFQTLPAWMAEAGGEPGSAATLFMNSAAADQAAGQTGVPASQGPRPSMAEIDGRREQRTQLNWILAILIVAAVIVLVLLAFLLSNTV